MIVGTAIFWLGMACLFVYVIRNRVTAWEREVRDRDADRARLRQVLDSEGRS